MYHHDHSDQLNTAIDSLRKGASLAHVLEQVSNPTTRSLIELAYSGMTIPTKDVPAPARRYKFMSVAPQPASLWLRMLPFVRVAVMPLSLVLVLMAGWVSKLTIESTPDQTLFAVKHAYEQLQLQLTKSPEDRANLQLAITQRRLNDAETVLKDNPDKQAQEAALIELATQTKNTLESVKEAQGKNTSMPAPLAARLSKIADQQQQLLKDLPSATPPTALAAATNSTAPSSAPTKASVLIATVHEETMATLASEKGQTTATVLTDTITATKDKTITLGKDTLVVVKDSVTIKLDGNSVSSDKLVVGAKVSVKVTKGADTQFYATEVTILEEAKPKITPKTAPKPVETPKEEVAPDPNTATTGFIPESPEPQYAP